MRLERVTAGIVSVVAALAFAPTRPAAAQEPALTSVVASDASAPSVSGDGRWVVFVGSDEGRRTVLRHDRETGANVELSLVPPGVRSGDTIHARVSADGCVVVATTEIAFDLFRDDDRSERWDVYRLVVPECGGLPNAWELISVDDRTGVALDGVGLESPATLSGTGAVVAYAHQAPEWPDGATTISIVDVTVPRGQPGRSTRVAGTPAEAPKRAFVYRGARQPVLSQNGRHLAFVADFGASDALPGWVVGPVPGGYATSQVYVWDRVAAVQQRSVHLVSGRGDTPSTSGADSPSLSEDGRIIAFVSRDRGLVPAILPSCFPACPTQVFRFDRDLDGNGIFDEIPRSNPLTLASGTPIPLGLPIAGNRSSWSPSVNFDGSQIVFVTDATNLMATRRGGGGESSDGDLLVAEHHLGTLRRVIDDPLLIGVPGAHGHPSSSDTGEVVVFDTAAGTALGGIQGDGGRSVAVVTVTPSLSLASLDFGTVLPGYDSAELYATVRNAGPAAFVPTSVRVTSAFRVTGGTCVRGIVVAAGQSCSVRLTLRPGGSSRYSGTLTVSGEGPGAPSVSAAVRGAGGRPTLLSGPGGVDLPDAVVDTAGGRAAVAITNIGFAATRVSGLAIGGDDPDDFRIVEESCTGRALNPDASCFVEVEFSPTSAGYRSALLIATAGGGVDPTTDGATTASVLGGYATYRPTLEIAGDAALPEVRPGAEVGIGGAGFPAGAVVAVGFDDGSIPFATVTADDQGSILAVVRLPRRIRGGDRELVASSVDGAIATTPLRVVVATSGAVPGLPGFGLG